jgi:hypothetical protein
MRNDNQSANLFATLGLGQGNATVNTRKNRLALVLAYAQYSPSARLERPIARAFVRICGGLKRVVKCMHVSVFMRRHAAHLPRLLGDGPAIWLIGSRISPAVCSVS